MRTFRTLLVACTLAGTALIGTPSASAHGNCAVTYTPPSWNSGDHHWTWTGVVQCSEDHPDYWQYACLESSLTNGLVDGWTTHWCSDWHYWAGPGKTFSWPYQPEAYRTCGTQRWYRVRGGADVGNGGAHWDLTGTSASVVGCPI